MFKKWHAERTPLRCQVLLSQIAAGFNCRVYSISDSQMIMASDDLRTEINIPLPNEVFFGYGEDRDDDPNDGPSPYGSGIVIFLEPVPEEGYGDMITVWDFKEPPSAV